MNAHFRLLLALSADFLSTPSTHYWYWWSKHSIFVILPDVIILPTSCCTFILVKHQLQHSYHHHKLPLNGRYHPVFLNFIENLPKFDSYLCVELVDQVCSSLNINQQLWIDGSSCHFHWYGFNQYIVFLCENMHEMVVKYGQIEGLSEVQIDVVDKFSKNTVVLKMMT